MKTYSVICKRGLLKKTKFVDIVADGFTPSGSRYFILSDESRIEIPSDFIVCFSPDRAKFIAKQEQNKQKQEEFQRISGKR